MYGGAPQAAAPTLPPGWSMGTDPNSGRAYYYNTSTNTTQWELPSMPKDMGAPSGGGGYPMSSAPSGPMMGANGGSGMGGGGGGGSGMGMMGGGAG
eukprot:CAMPEP_0181326060 /NCGR_PEP_ID=MMETSP1101-20121128/21279_1 /TAXON_ID=46948 /ORGANISM="Rhodomonas abbreviata, Strain Caron Lab Isolate" /LENGTH=95 /DNA_ID=CAMNT_0023434453 /DNA_START=204 /DNA_END=487 /DNA_ORIENTATION=-